MRKLYSGILLSFFVFVVMLASETLFSQDKADSPASVESTLEAQVAVEPAVLRLFNRPIVILRAPSFGHPPSDRIRNIEERFSEIVKSGKIGKVSTRPVVEGIIISIDDEILMMFSNKDYDPLSKDTMETSVGRAVAEVEKVLELVRRQKDPKVNLIGAGYTLAGLLIFIIVIILLHRIQRWIRPGIDRFEDSLDSKLREIGVSSFTIKLNLLGLLNRMIYALVLLFCVYALVAFSLLQFPYTEPWGRKLGGYIIGIIGNLSSKAVDSMPGLLVVFIIFMLTSWVARISRTFFKSVADGDVVISWLDSDAALPTAKIFSGIIWIFGIVMAYPYIPGSNTEAFKGIGMFLGLLVSLGASSMVGQVIGGMVLMYSRAMKVGDVVQVGEYYGKVMEIGFFSTKLRTLKNEEINIPNSVLMGSTSKNFTRLSKTEGLIVHSSVTIGYDVPWRQVHAMLINAAEKTEGLQKNPAPFVLQKDLKDFYVEYEINGFVGKPDGIMKVKTDLHANIQDEFNSHGVQIMSPNYEDQPAEKVWVPKEKWYEAPAKKEKS